MDECSLCHILYEEKGALLFSPPLRDLHKLYVLKHHICRHCYQDILNLERPSKAVDAT